VTWARVSDAIDQRLRSAAPVIAPHEWGSGDKLWLIDVVAPFGDAPGIARQALREMPGSYTSANAWLPGADGRAVLTEVRRDG
jgi:cytolysin-activating lysine-acyltransferase